MRNFVPFSLNIHGRLVEFTRPQIMGILNVTPDSFYAASRKFDAESIAEHARRLISQGADMLDLGAYSTRPGADTVTEDEELRRLEIGISAIRKNVSQDIIISIDTFRANVAKRAVGDLGADIVNDISGGDMDPLMYSVVAELNVPYIMMHTRGTPQTMQSMAKYDDVTAEVLAELAAKLSRINELGINDVIIDPGFGFAKDLRQNYRMMRQLELFHILERPLLVGISRKSMIYKALGGNPDDALAGTTALNTIALLQGAAILRVHDPKDAADAAKIVSLTLNS